MTARIERAVWVVPGTTLDRHGSVSNGRESPTGVWDVELAFDSVRCAKRYD